MLGIGETEVELRAGLRQLRDAGIDVVTFGQYLRPSKRHMPVERYVTPEEFEMWKAEADSMGFV
jgi:lipoyl synthase